MMLQLGSAREGAELANSFAVLSAMITPAVLISACGSLAISTSNRLSRTIDRTRLLSTQFAALAAEVDRPGLEERRALMFSLLARATRRSKLLQRAMTRIYFSIGVFVATSVAIGIVAVLDAGYAWIPITLGLIGAGVLFHATFLLIVESRLALQAIRKEMDFEWSAGQSIAGAELIASERMSQSRAARMWHRLMDDEE